MIDLHCHILPKVDDGSTSIEETIAILKEAVEVGFDTICFTPHYVEPQYVNTKKQNQEIVEKVKEKLEQENISLNLLLGNEIFITEKMVELLEQGNITTLGETEYILIELPMYQELDKNVVRKFINTLLERKLKVIIAHPERYTYIQRKPENILQYFGNNVIFQGNYTSIIGGYGIQAKKTIKKLLKNNVINFLSTDTHRLKTSYYDQIEKINKKLLKWVNNDYFELLTQKNPSLIIENKNIIKLPINSQILADIEEGE